MWDKSVPGSMTSPKFSAVSWHALARRTRREAALESAIARWLGARAGLGAKVRERFGDVAARVVAIGGAVEIDPHAARCELRRAGETIAIHGSAELVRAIAQRLLGGPQELAAPRPLGAVEHALWALAVAAALDDLGVDGEVWPGVGPRASSLGPRPEAIAVEIEVRALGVTGSVVAIVPAAIEVCVPPRGLPAWSDAWVVEAPIVVARCALAREAVRALAVRDLVTVEPALDLELFGGAVGLRAAKNAVVAEVANEYVRRDMAVQDAQVELAVTLGTTRLTLRQVLGLTVGEIVQLGRPLAGPFEVRAEGRIVGQGELVDVDGELAVRILSLDPSLEKSE